MTSSSSDCPILQAIFPTLNIPVNCCGIGSKNDDPLIIVCGGGRLVSLYITNNDVTGTFPEEIFKFDQLLDLSLTTKIFGSVPDQFGRLPNLRGLAIRGPVTGTLPDSIGQLTSLTSLVIENTSMGGPLKTWIGQLVKLEQLYINRGLFSGQIPQEVARLPKLREVALQNNQLSGQIPDFTAIVGYTDLGFNFFTGNLPKNAAQLKISYNCFKPEALVSLKNSDPSIDLTQRQDSECGVISQGQTQPGLTSTPSQTESTATNLSSRDSTTLTTATTSNADSLISGAPTSNSSAIAPSLSGSAPITQSTSQTGSQSNSSSEGDPTSSIKAMLIGILAALASLVVVAALVVFWMRSKMKRKRPMKRKLELAHQQEPYKDVEGGPNRNSGRSISPEPIESFSKGGVPTSRLFQSIYLTPMNLDETISPSEKQEMDEKEGLFADISSQAYRPDNARRDPETSSFKDSKSLTDARSIPSKDNDSRSIHSSNAGSSSMGAFNTPIISPPTSSSLPKAVYVSQDFPLHPSTWTIDTVSSWLRSKEVAETIVELFYREKVDGSKLLHLDAAGMSSLGLSLSEDTIHFSSQLKTLKESWGVATLSAAELPEYSN
ncbi:hypothetical protein HDU97_001012 [Phlyctochytrium planicorne]|nr:hypothetical protein HDU97_001012 [Phlyctochytrium planicorne]